MKLSEDDVREIRRLFGDICAACGGKPSLRAVGQRFGVSAVTVLAIVERRTWRDIEEPGPPPAQRASKKQMYGAAELLEKMGHSRASHEQIRFATEVIRAARNDTLF